LEDCALPKPDFRDLIGVPFAYNSRELKNGLDCLGVVMEARRRLGLYTPDIRIACYDAVEIGLAVVEEAQKWVRLEDPTPGCIALMAIDPERPGMIQHLGVYIGDGRIIHTLFKVNSSVIRIDDPYWSKKIKGYYEWIP